jgi:hypothetical protein
MGWREKMKSKTPTRNPINPKNLRGEGVSSVSRVNSKGSENKKGGYPIPTDETEFAEDERRAIIDVDGGVEPMPVKYPVEVKMESAILGGTADVMLWPDRATVDGVQYTNDELKDLLSRNRDRETMVAVHEAKRGFSGEVLSAVEQTQYNKKEDNHGGD